MTPPLNVVGIDVRTINEPGRVDQDIPKLRDRFIEGEIAEKTPAKKSDNIFCFYSDYEGDHTNPYSVTIGSEVSEVNTLPEGLVSKKAPESTYAVFEAKGQFPESLIQTWMTIWSSPLKRTFIGDFEVYPKDFFDHPETHSLKIYIGIEE